ncbi:ABC transporter ATP-binding protein [Candidatus Uabimicrobium sp. HlEnr_7]|uniref:ABC transporter ATP-binding protein n=1 Tax=Candidatus Uabimicrobium helgolandensis TaxID=3095367 RepID=UPI003556F99B
MITLQIENLSKTYDKNTVVTDFSLEVAKGEIVALIGESGSGKSTILKMISGFEKPSAGSIEINNETVCSKQVFVEPENRQVAMVFPDHSLFPHLSAEKNIAFALNKHSRSERKRIVNQMLQLIGLEELRKNKPHQMSSGQLQRIALARSLAFQPKLLLLDEPLSKLDVMLKKRMREEIKQIITQTETTTILVTHDKEDAFVIADRVVVLKDGVTQQMDTPEGIYFKPKNEYVAHFFGRVNTIHAERNGKGYNTPLGCIQAKENGECCRVLIRPENLNIGQQSDDAIPATITKITFYGQQKELQLQLCESQQLITVVIPNYEKVNVGQQLFCKLNTEELTSWAMV